MYDSRIVYNLMCLCWNDLFGFEWYNPANVWSNGLCLKPKMFNFASKITTEKPNKITHLSVCLDAVPRFHFKCVCEIIMICHEVKTKNLSKLNINYNVLFVYLFSSKFVMLCIEHKLI